jgi:hypothetical protein
MKWTTVMLVVLLFGCTNRTTVPPELIQQPEMQKIMWEMVQADRYSASYIQVRKDTLHQNENAIIDLYDKVFSYNGVTREKFRQSYRFYLGHPDMLKVIFDSISIQAERKRSEPLLHPKNDSLKKKTVDTVRKRIVPKPPLRLPHE